MPFFMRPQRRCRLKHRPEKDMDFIEATKELVSGGRIVSDEYENGAPRELVLECGAVFIKVPRSKGAKADNYIFHSPSADDIISESWRKA